MADQEGEPPESVLARVTHEDRRYKLVWYAECCRADVIECGVREIDPPSWVRPPAVLQWEWVRTKAAARDWFYEYAEDRGWDRSRIEWDRAPQQAVWDLADEIGAGWQDYMPTHEKRDELVPAHVLQAINRAGYSPEQMAPLVRIHDQWSRELMPKRVGWGERIPMSDAKRYEREFKEKYEGLLGE